MKILVMTTSPRFLSSEAIVGGASHGKWGIKEMADRYRCIKIVPIKNIFLNTLAYIREDFDVLFIHNCSPVRFFPLHLIRILLPKTKSKKIICLSHASIFGKSREAVRWRLLGGALSWFVQGYDKMLFFSPKSMGETVNAGVMPHKCCTINWGADMAYLQRFMGEIEDKGFWLSPGKECRDFNTMERVAELLHVEERLKILYGGLEYEEVMRLTAQCKGVLVITNRKGLNYCAGLTCIVEAFAFGKPIIAVRNPYYPFDIEEEGCGLYVDSESAEQIAAAIRKIDGDETLYHSMCIASKRMSSVYNMEQYSDELFTLIGSIRTASA